jgi:hypothetical protein
MHIRHKNQHSLRRARTCNSRWDVRFTCPTATISRGIWPGCCDAAASALDWLSLSCASVLRAVLLRFLLLAGALRFCSLQAFNSVTDSAAAPVGFAALGFSLRHAHTHKSPISQHSAALQTHNHYRTIQQHRGAPVRASALPPRASCTGVIAVTLHLLLEAEVAALAQALLRARWLLLPFHTLTPRCLFNRCSDSRSAAAAGALASVLPTKQRTLQALDALRTTTAAAEIPVKATALVGLGQLNA